MGPVPQTTSPDAKDRVKNPVNYFELPVADLDRAMAFYAAVFGEPRERTEIDRNQMALFPARDGASGIAGALAKGNSYLPGKQGARLYFSTPDIDETLRRVQRAGSRVLYAKTSNGTLGWVAEFEDSEGNCIALHSE